MYEEIEKRMRRGYGRQLKQFESDVVTVGGRIRSMEPRRNMTPVPSGSRFHNLI